MIDEQRITFLGRTNHRNSGVPFGIRQRDRRSHMYVCGKTGTGKSHLLRISFEQDVDANQGCALLDPHGDLADWAALRAGRCRHPELIYLNAADPRCLWRINPFFSVPAHERARAAANLVETFKKIWPDDWGPRLEHLWRNVALTLLEQENGSFADIPALLSDRTFRSAAVNRVENPIVQDFWKNEFERYSPGFKAVVIAPLQNKIGALLTDPILHRVLTEPGVQLNFRNVIDTGRVVVANLDRGRLGEGPSAVLGSIIISGLALAGLSRSDIPEADRRDFWIYADEFQTFTTLSVASILAELRKYRVGAILANQHLSQLDQAIRDAVFGNAGSILSFRVGAADAAYLAREFAPVFSPEDFTSLPRYHVYLRLLVDGEPSRPFSATTLSGLDDVVGKE